LNPVEESRNHDERDGVAKRQPMTPSASPKNLLGFVAHILAVFDDHKIRLNFVQKTQSRPKAHSISHKGNGLADDVPSSDERSGHRIGG
jgi:hypothetical protein